MAIILCFSKKRKTKKSELTEMEQRVEDVINEDDKEIMDIIDHLDKALTEEPTRIVDDDEDSTVSAEVESTKVSNAATLEGAEKYTLVSTEPIVAVSFDAGTFFYKVGSYICASYKKKI